jgi:hypothetical protein
MRHIVMFSGGIGSWAAAKRVVQQSGTAKITLLFMDTLGEDADLYRFLDDASANIGAPITRIAEGRTIWEVFQDEKFLGTNRVGLCSRILKQEVADKWLSDNCDPADTAVYVGIDWTEIHRIERLAERRKPWIYKAPMCQPPYMDKPAMLAWAIREGLRVPRLYDMGFSHNNCGGGCVKAGIGHWTHLYRTLPDVYAEWERNENHMRDQLGNVAILRDRSGGSTTPLPLTQLRKRLNAGHQPDLFEVGGCGCFTEESP